MTEKEICAVCGGEIEKTQRMFKIKLDDGKIVLSHGYPCCERFEIKRKKPILSPDWWIQEVHSWERVRV